MGHSNKSENESTPYISEYSEGLKEEDRDAFRFLFNIKNQEQHFRFARVPFGMEASPFMLGGTINYHLDHQPNTLATTVHALQENTYVDNLMQVLSDIEELNKFRGQATHIFELAGFPVHKCCRVRH